MGWPATLLFVPAHQSNHAERARDTGVPLILDLEDAVPMAEKSVARTAAVRLIGELPGRCAVRVNAPGGDLGEADLEAVVTSGVARIVVPKVDDAATLREVDRTIRALEERCGLQVGSTKIGAIIESARGVINVHSIAAAPVGRDLQLAFGSGDLSADLGVEWSTDESVLESARASVPLAARAANLGAPLDGVYPVVRDVDGLRDSANRGKALGYAGKPAIHPLQIDVIKSVFGLTVEQVDEARSVVEAAIAASRKGAGAFVMDGRLVDEAVVRRARDVLATSEDFSDIAT